MCDPGPGTHNVLYVVTMNDICTRSTPIRPTDAPLVSLDVTSEVPAELVSACIDDILGFNDNIIGNVGIESTPVIDLSTNTIYVVVRTETSDSSGATANESGRSRSACMRST